MGFEPAKGRLAQFRNRPPPDLGEFALVRTQGLPDMTGEGEPEADVNMPRRERAHGLGHREEKRPVLGRRVGLRDDAELFDGLPPDGVERMLARLDMPSGRQPQAGQPVIAEQHAPGRPVDEQKVRHQMW